MKFLLVLFLSFISMAHAFRCTKPLLELFPRKMSTADNLILVELDSDSLDLKSYKISLNGPELIKLNVLDSIVAPSNRTQVLFKLEHQPKLGSYKFEVKDSAGILKDIKFPDVEVSNIKKVSPGFVTIGIDAIHFSYQTMPIEYVRLKSNIQNRLVQFTVKNSKGYVGKAYAFANADGKIFVGTHGCKQNFDFKWLESYSISLNSITADALNSFKSNEISFVAKKQASTTPP